MRCEQRDVPVPQHQHGRARQKGRKKKANISAVWRIRKQAKQPTHLELPNPATMCMRWRTGYALREGSTQGSAGCRPSARVQYLGIHHRLHHRRRRLFLLATKLRRPAHPQSTGSARLCNEAATLPLPPPQARDKERGLCSPIGPMMTDWAAQASALLARRSLSSPWARWLAPRRPAALPSHPQAMAPSAPGSRTRARPNPVLAAACRPGIVTNCWETYSRAGPFIVAAARAQGVA